MEKHFVDRKKRQNGEEKETEMKGGKTMRMWNSNENLNIENCLNKD